MAEELSMVRPLVDRAARLCDELSIAEVPLQRPVMGAEGPGAAGPSEGDDMRVVGLTEPCRHHLGLFASHLRRRHLPRDAGPEQLHHEPPRPLQPAQLVGQMSAHYEAAVSLLEPVQNGNEIRVRRTAEDEARQVGVDDQAHGQPPRNRRSSSRKKLRYPGGGLTMLPCSSSSRRWIVASPFFRSK